MSSIIFLIVLFFLIYYDAKILRQQDEGAYRLCLRSLPFVWALLCFLFFVVTLPIYLLRRRQFILLRNEKRTLVFASQQYSPSRKLLRSLHWRSIIKAKENKKAPTRPGAFEITPLDQLSDCLGMVILWMSGIFLLTVFADFISTHLLVLRTKLGEAIFSTMSGDVLMIFLIYGVTRKYPGGGFWTSVGLPQRKVSFLKVIFIPAMAGFVLAYFVSLSRMNDMHPPATPLSQLLGTASPNAVLFFLGSAILLAPLIEEIIFRGYFYGVASRLKGKFFAVCFVAVSFALMHVWQYWGDWMAIGVVTVLGFVLSFFRAVNGLTLSSIVTHYVYNGFSVILPFLFLMQSHSIYFEYQFKYNQLDDSAKEELLKKSIEKQPRWDPAYNDLAWLYAQKGEKLDKALPLIAEALKMDPDNDAYWDTKAEVLFRLKRFAEAIEIEKSLISRNPDEEIYKNQLEKFKKGFAQERKRQALAENGFI